MQCFSLAHAFDKSNYRHGEQHIIEPDTGDKLTFVDESQTDHSMFGSWTTDGRNGLAGEPVGATQPGANGHDASHGLLQAEIPRSHSLSIVNPIACPIPRYGRMT
jgi:hypothetical protein